MSVSFNSLHIRRASDPGPKTEYMNLLHNEYGYLDYSDIAQICITDTNRRKLEEVFHKTTTTSIKRDADEDIRSLENRVATPTPPM